MSRITRDGFIDQFQSTAGLDVTKLDGRTQAALEQAGLGADALASLGGQDHTIDTRAELGRLFDLIDRVDHDGHFNSIETTTVNVDGRFQPTASGEVYEALEAELARARQGATGAAPGKPDPTALPSPADCAASLGALGAAGFSNIHLKPTPYFNQGEKPWAAHEYPRNPPDPGESRTIKNAGCAPCALAMIDCALRGARTSPIATAEFAVANHFSGSSRAPGTDTAGLAKSWADAHGLMLTAATSADQSKNLDALKAGLQANGLALVSVGADAEAGHGHFTNGGHVLVVNGCATKNGEEWFSVVNPGRKDQNDGKGTLLGVDTDVVQVSGAKNGIGSVWISKTQLEAEMRRCFILRTGGES